MTNRIGGAGGAGGPGAAGPIEEPTAEPPRPPELPPHDHAARRAERPRMFTSGAFSVAALQAKVGNTISRLSETASTAGAGAVAEPELDAPRRGEGLLRRGDRGPAVEALQRALNAAGIEPPLEVDGVYDAAVVEAVRRFQEANGCIVDGIVGPETMGAIDRVRGLEPNPAAAEAAARYRARFRPSSAVREAGPAGAGAVGAAAGEPGELSGGSIDRIVARTAEFESSGRYDAWNPDDNGHGVSFGLIQFNQEVGGLPRLLRAMHERDPERFRQTFGPYADRMLDENWVRSADLNAPEIKRRLRASGRDPVFQAVQRDQMRRSYMGPAERAVREAGLRSERALALAFDSSVQNGPGRTRRWLLQAAREGGSEREILERFARLADRGRTNGRRAKLLRDPGLSDGPVVAAARNETVARTARGAATGAGVAAAEAAAASGGPLLGAPIGPGTRVLMIGDSHTVGAFGEEMDRLLRETGATVSSYGSAGSSPSWWLSGRPTRSGFVARRADGTVERPDWRQPHATPRLEELIERERPDVLVVSMGGNFRGLSPAGIRRQVQQLAEVARRHGTRLVWVGPPDRAADERDPTEITRFNRILREAVAPYGAFVDSTPYTEYAGGDGIHYTGARGRERARQWARGVFGEIQGERG